MSTKKTSPAKKAPAKKAPAKKAPAKKTPAKKTPAKKAPQVAIVAIPFEVRYLDETAAECVVSAEEEEVAVAARTWFAVSIAPPVAKRYLHVLQVEEAGTFLLYMLADRDAEGGSPALRLPRVGAYMRALVTGSLHVLGADSPLSREQIAKHIGGHEPPPQQAKPPYT